MVTDVKPIKSKMLQTRQIDKNNAKQVRVDASIHQLLKIRAAESGETLRSLIEGSLGEMLGVKNKKKYY